MVPWGVDLLAGVRGVSRTVLRRSSRSCPGGPGAESGRGAADRRTTPANRLRSGITPWPRVDDPAILARKKPTHSLKGERECSKIHPPDSYNQ